MSLTWNTFLHLKGICICLPKPRLFLPVVWIQEMVCQNGSLALLSAVWMNSCSVNGYTALCLSDWSWDMSFLIWDSADGPNPFLYRSMTWSRCLVSLSSFSRSLSGSFPPESVGVSTCENLIASCLFSMFVICSAFVFGLNLAKISESAGSSCCFHLSLTVRLKLVLISAVLSLWGIVIWTKQPLLSVFKISWAFPGSASKKAVSTNLTSHPQMEVLPSGGRSLCMIHEKSLSSSLID